MKNAERFDGVDPNMVRVIKRAEVYAPFPLILLEGVRTRARQMELYAQGRTAPGKKVTWTMNSPHLTGRAVDIAPYINNNIPWNDVDKFIVMGLAVYQASDELFVPVKWGYDWDGDRQLREHGESDGPHFELV